MKEKRNSVMENITLERVPDSQRKPWYSIAFIWAGGVICIPALMVGSYVSVGLNFKQSVIAMIIGYCIVVAYMTLLGCTSSDLGVPTTVSISRAYGVHGSSFMVSLIIAVSMIGWFGYQTGLCANSFNSIMATSFGVSIQMWLSSVIWGIFAVIRNGSVSVISSYQPATDLGMAYGITLAVAGFASGAICCGDYTRYCKNRKDTLISSVVGVLPAGIGALVIGAVLSLSTGSYDLSIVFSNFGLPVVGMLVLILATWTTNTGNAYSSGIAIVNMFKMRDEYRSTMTLVCGVIGTVLAISGVIGYFVNFLNIIGYFVPPVAGVAIADYWIMGGGKARDWKPFDGVNWLGVVSWVVGAATAAFSTFFVPTINGIIVSMLLYCILTAVIKNDKVNPIEALKKERAANQLKDDKVNTIEG